jgi:hypothetical protein
MIYDIAGGALDREYPAAETTPTLLGKTVHTETLTVSGANYGHGSYILYYSSIFTTLPNREFILLFDNDLIESSGGTLWANNSYAATTGAYVSTNYIISSYTGHW